MDIKAKIRDVLKFEYGDFNTHLEHVYENKITESLADGTIKDKQEWITYNQVILELKHSIKDMLRVKELQYKLTDNLEPNKVCIEVLKKVRHFTPELQRLYEKIRNF